MVRPRVVLVHGTLDRASSFGRVRRHLADVDTTAYDRRGYASRVDDGPGTLDDHVHDLLRVLDERPAVVAGHSLGADIALAAAVRRPDLVVAVVSYEAPMPWQPWWPPDTAGGMAVAAAREPEAAAEAFMRRMVGDERWERLPARTQAARRAEGGAVLAELRSIREEAPFDLADVSVPVVVGVGTESLAHQQAAAPEVVAALPCAELHRIEGARHGAHLSHPAEFAALVHRAVVLAGKSRA